MCNHDWQPIPNWYARYRCSICHAVGAKFGVVCAKYGVRSTEIRPYRCEARPGGVKCENPAVDSVRGKHFRCAEHPRRARGTRARQELTEARGDKARVETEEVAREESQKSTEPLSRSASDLERGE
jgi:hypothetical protein